MVRDLRDLASATEKEAIGQLLAATVRIDSGSNQGEILFALLEESRRFASRTAFFLTRSGEVRGWAGRGFGNVPVEEAVAKYDDGSVWSQLAAKTGVVALDSEGCAVVCRGLGVPPASEGVLIPFMLRGQLGGAVYADRLGERTSLGVASLQLLAHTAAQTIETAAVRGSGGSPALRSSSDGIAMPLWQPPAAEDAPDRPAAAVGAAVAAGAAMAAVAASAAPSLVAPAEEVPAEEEPAAELVAEEEGAVTGEAVVAEDLAAEDLATEDLAAEEDVAEDRADEAVDFEMVSAVEGDEPLAADSFSEEDLSAVDDISVEMEPEPELEDTSELWAEDDDEATFISPASVDEIPLDEPPAPAAPVLPPDLGQQTVRLDVAALQGRVPETVPGIETTEADEDTARPPHLDVEPLPEPGAADFELEPEEEMSGYDLDAEPSEAVTAAIEAPDFSEDATMMSSRADLGKGYVPPAPIDVATPSTEVTPPPSAGFAAPPAKTESTGSTQVVPPTDIQGPGSAFATASATKIPDGEEALHEEARRLARLLVSEIKLYNEEIIEEGRRAGNIYDRLKDDINRSRQMYEERIDPRLKEGDSDYFRQELVQRLAGGDEQILGY